MRRAISVLRRFVRKDDGQDLVEYGLLVVLIAVVAMAGVTTLGVKVNTAFWQFIVNSF
jgi:Flp pilus assembly pilin Flp